MRLDTWHSSFQCESRLQVVQVHSSRLNRQSTKSAYGRLMAVPFRAKLAELVSPLRRVRSKTPFFELAAHRIPTLWSLYRGLLRNSPTEDVFLTCTFLCIRAYTTIIRRSRFASEHFFEKIVIQRGRRRLGSFSLKAIRWVSMLWIWW